MMLYNNSYSNRDLYSVTMFFLVVNGAYSPWSDWTPCTVTCGGGESMRTRQCTNPSPEFGGKDCSSLGKSTEIMKCKNDPCPGNSLNFVAPNVVLHVLLQQVYQLLLLLITH